MMPNMQTVMYGFEETLQFQLVTKTAVDGDIVESSTVRPVLWFQGVIQPLNPRELLVKSEGERKFKWWTLVTDLILSVDAIVKDERGIEYRVMTSADWSQSGYHQYQLVEGPGL